VSAHILASFERAAAGYREHARVQAALADWLAKWLPAKRSGRALEVGAGTGLLTQKLVDWPGGVTATDIAPAMCAAGQAFLPQADWKVMAAESPLTGPWDWIFSSGMLQWIKDPVAVFSAWREQLAREGQVVAALFAAESLPEWRQVGGNDALIWRSPEIWRDALKRAGLKLRRDAVERRVFHYPSARAFLKTLHGVGAAPRRQFTPGQLRRLMKDYDGKFGGAAGVPATWTFFRFEAVRAD
jgi:malonyl-CoA O-methyltransferase